MSAKRSSETFSSSSTPSACTSSNKICICARSFDDNCKDPSALRAISEEFVPPPDVASPPVSVVKKHCPICRHRSSSLSTPNCFQEFHTFLRRAFSSSFFALSNISYTAFSQLTASPKIMSIYTPFTFFRRESRT